MSSAAGSERGAWFGPALAIVLAVTAARVVLLAWDQKQLFVDEAQYWFWGQDLALGYFSKPPLIAWLIRAVTDIAGSDAPFWVRFPAPLLHGLTAMLLGAIAARLAGAAAALWTVAAYLTLPVVTVGSLLITTDTLMFPFLAAGYLAWTTAIPEERPLYGAVSGALVGVAFLAKYAAFYYLGAAILAAAFVPAARPSWRVALSAVAAFAIVASPNVLWNLGNGLITLQHTVDNIEWARAPSDRLGLEWEKLGEFVGAQLFVMGPILFGALLWAAARWSRIGPALRTLLLFSLPIVAVVCAQALLSRAYANWAAAAYLTGTVAVTLWLLSRSRGWLAAGVGLNALLAIGISVVVTLPDWLPDGARRIAMDRYLGRVELSEAIIDLARQEGLDTVVAENRDVLADLFYTGRDSGLAFRSIPWPDRPPHHYAMSWAFEGSAEDVLFIGDEAPDCVAGTEPIVTLAPAPGYWTNRPKLAWRVPGDCWAE